ncbi:MAG: glycosyltransferase family 2 protein [Pseudanabaena sp. ELA645]
MKTPVAFIIFNRPDTTKRVFEAIRQAKPPKLFVIADGPRSDRPEDVKKCAAARAIIDGVDWECEVLTNYSDINLGCGKRLPTGITWVFEQVEEAIILEDDCLPDPSFFPFCEELLERYRDDTRIAIISGNNLLGRRTSLYSYYFSKYPYTWGWATWKRAWKYYDQDMNLWTEIKSRNWLENILTNKKAVKYWKKIFQNTYDGKATTVWDYQWTFACLTNNFLSIVPNVNLISNIGFGQSSTHTKDSDNKLSNLPTQEINFPLVHMPCIINDIKSDVLADETIFDTPLINRMKKLIRLLLKFSRKSLRIFNKI